MYLCYYCNLDVIEAISLSGKLGATLLYIQIKSQINVVGTGTKLIIKYSLTQTTYSFCNKEKLEYYYYYGRKTRHVGTYKRVSF